MYRVERSHWWYTGMESITRGVPQRWYRHGEGLRIPDAGCGTGAAMTRYLTDYGSVTGFDLSAPALHFSRLRHAERLVCASVLQMPFASDAFDLVTSFDVLYEAGVRSDALAVREMCRVLRPAGRLLLRLPAYEWLRSRHDKAVHTARRYTAGQVGRILHANGFIIEQLSHANMFLFPLALIVRIVGRIMPGGSHRSDLDMPPGMINAALRAVLSAEAPLVALSRLPFGLSVVAVGRKAGA